MAEENLARHEGKFDSFTKREKKVQIVEDDGPQGMPKAELQDPANVFVPDAGGQGYVPEERKVYTPQQFQKKTAAEAEAAAKEADGVDETLEEIKRSVKPEDLQEELDRQIAFSTNWRKTFMYIFGWEGIGYLFYMLLFVITVFANRPGEKDFFMFQTNLRAFYERELPFKESPFPMRHFDTNELGNLWPWLTYVVSYLLTETALPCNKVPKGLVSYGMLVIVTHML